MIASNRNSWALSDFGGSANESGAFSPTETHHDTTAPLSIRSVNRLEGNRLASGGEEKKEKPKTVAPVAVSEQPITPTTTYTPPTRGPKTSIANNDENVPPSPTPRKPTSFGRGEEQPRHQRSILSLRHKPSSLMTMR